MPRPPTRADVAAVRHASREMVRELGMLQASYMPAALSTSQCHALLEIGEGPGLSQNELAARLRLDKSTTSRIVRQLVARGWVATRLTIADQRRRPLHVTARGRARLRRVRETADARVAGALGLLDDGQRAAVCDGLATYAAALERSRRRAGCALRTLRRADNAVLASVMRRVMAELQAVGPGFAINDAEIDDMAGAYRGARARYFVATDAGVVVGGGGFARLSGSDAHTCELRKMYLLPAVRGLGLGQQLLARCLAEAHRLGFRRVYLETLTGMADARALYERNGFRPIAKPMGHTGHFGCDAWYVRAL
jgi:putative acetyltransferase